ncbi:zinc metallochaperone AztD [Sinomonas mesophila]|uniref:zinc metallochaperone AztD n=1 Tax=Sinomonas mesophila TaxID=1531955 RepID=UPI0009868581|nr:zinc metallochaperone AztD [Sinomonas mesophila]
MLSPDLGRFALPTATLRGGVVAAALTAVFALSACGGPAPASSAESASPAASAGAKAAERSRAMPRLVLTTEGGLMTLNAATLEPVGETVPLDGFLRINPAGDGRHVLVSTERGFEVFDAGTWGEPHGDHDHFYTWAPRLTGTVFDADHPGHAVHHAGSTALFADGTGEVTVFDPAGLQDGAPEAKVSRTPEAHHGVAVPLPEGGLLTTRSHGEKRVGITVLAADGTEAASSEDCPGTHGEATAAGAVVVGCTDGALVYSGGQIRKVQAPDAYGRIGNQSGSEHSPIVLGDYKVDKDAELERPTRISLIDTRTASLRHVELGTSYSFRSLGRGPAGEALLLGTDGGLRVIDPETGAVARTIPVVAPWTESETWQDPRPTLFVQGSTAYVTEPAARRLHAVDLATGAVVKTAELPAVPNEITGVTGTAS